MSFPYCCWKHFFLMKWKVAFLWHCLLDLHYLKNRQRSTLRPEGQNQLAAWENEQALKISIYIDHPEALWLLQLSFPLKVFRHDQENHRNSLNKPIAVHCDLSLVPAFRSKQFLAML